MKSAVPSGKMTVTTNHPSHRLKRAAAFTAACVLVFALLSGCQSEGSDNTSNDGDFTIVTSFYPVYISVINVTEGIDSVNVVNMTAAQTGCLHDYQLTPKDLETLSNADAFVINGAGMEAFLDDVIAQYPDLVIINASEGIETLTDENGDINPHVWVSITDAMAQVRNISNEIASLDTANAIRYKSNASLYLTELNALRKDAAEDLASLKTRDIVTFHEAFPYFAKEFDLNILSVITQEPDTTPTAKELEETIRIVSESSVKALFVEPQYSDESARTVAEATGAKIFTLDPIVTGDATSGAIDDYLEKMEKNIDTLIEALG